MFTLRSYNYYLNHLAFPAEAPLQLQWPHNKYSTNSLYPQRKITLSFLFNIVYISVLRGDDCPTGSFDLVEWHIWMTLSAKSIQ